MTLLLLLATVVFGLSGCSTVYYGIMEKLGVPKRDIMVDRVKAARDTLRKASQQKYDITKAKYEELVRAMKKAESKLEPALAPLRDQVLFMKHNLNARALAGLSDEVVTVQTNVDRLVRDMEIAIAQADKFIVSLQEE
jgi:hypothetical protein